MPNQFFQKSERKYGPRGAAQLTPATKSFKLRFDAGQTFDFGWSALSLPRGAKLPAGRYYASVSERGDTLWGLTPWTGTVIAEYREIAHRKDQPPVPAHKQGVGTGESGEVYQKDEYTFNIVFDIVSGPYAGLQVAMSCLYFSARTNSGFNDDGEGFAVYKGNFEKSPRAKKLAALFEVLGEPEPRIPFSDNVLPALHALFFKRKKSRVMLVLSSGYIDSLAAPLATRAKPKAKKK